MRRGRGGREGAATTVRMGTSGTAGKKLSNERSCIVHAKRGRVMEGGSGVYREEGRGLTLRGGRFGRLKQVSKSVHTSGDDESVLLPFPRSLSKQDISRIATAESSLSIILYHADFRSEFVKASYHSTQTPPEA